jgi:hypothetical protein
MLGAIGHDHGGIGHDPHTGRRGGAARTDEEKPDVAGRDAGLEKPRQHLGIVAQEEDTARLGIQALQGIAAARVRSAAARDDAAQALVARAISREKDQPTGLVPQGARPVPGAKLHARDRLHADRPRRVVQAHLPVEIFHIRQGEGSVAEGGGAADQSLDGRRAVSGRELARDVERDEHLYAPATMNPWRRRVSARCSSCRRRSR